MRPRSIDSQVMDFPLKVRFDYATDVTRDKHRLTFFIEGPDNNIFDLLTVESPAVTRVNCKYIAADILEKAFGQLIFDATEHLGYTVLWRNSNIDPEE